MHVRRLPPSRALAAYVECFTVVETAAEVARVLVPDGRVVLGLRYAGEACLDAPGAVVPEASFTGVTQRARRMTTRAGGGVILAMLRPARASAVLGAPLHEAFGHTLALADLLPRRAVERAHDQVRRAACDADRIAAFEALLGGQLGAVAADPVVERAVAAIEASRGGCRIAALAHQLGIGQDALEKRFRRAVGAPPKRLASIVRLRHAVAALRPGADLAAVALAAGYFDQAHFHRDLRAATGTSPGRLLAGAADYC